MKILLQLLAPALVIRVLILGMPAQAELAAPTRFGNVMELEGDVTCGRGTGWIHTFLETENFLVYVCGDETNPDQPRFYRSFNREGELGLSLIAEDYDPQQGRYLIFNNGGYEYILDGGNAQTGTALLIVRDPEGTVQLEEPALRYLSRTLTEAAAGCQPEESLFVEAETVSFNLFICGGDLPNTYVGINKNDGSSIRLPLQSYEPTGERFEAVNGDVRYLLTPQRLTVMQSTSTLVDEPIGRWN
jgi:hypothetical protein